MNGPFSLPTIDPRQALGQIIAKRRSSSRCDVHHSSRSSAGTASRARISSSDGTVPVSASDKRRAIVRSSARGAAWSLLLLPVLAEFRIRAARAFGRCRQPAGYRARLCRSSRCAVGARRRRGEPARARNRPACRSACGAEAGRQSRAVPRDTRRQTGDCEPTYSLPAPGFLETRRAAD